MRILLFCFKMKKKRRVVSTRSKGLCWLAPCFVCVSYLTIENHNHCLTLCSISTLHSLSRRRRPLRRRNSDHRPPNSAIPAPETTPPTAVDQKKSEEPEHNPP